MILNEGRIRAIRKAITDLRRESVELATCAAAIAYNQAIDDCLALVPNPDEEKK